MPARALIIDDEAPARAELRHQLADFADVVVVGEATTAEEAEVLIDSVGYDLVFLDIRMPGVGGFALAERLARAQDSPAIIFTTAFPDHAVEAFDLDAADYLVKPFEPDRLRRAVERALVDSTASMVSPTHDGDVEVERGVGRRLEAAGLEAGPDGAGTRGRPGRAAGGSARIPVHRGERIVLVEEPRIAFAEAARGYAYLSLIPLSPGHPLAGTDRLLTSHTLADLEERLSEAFVRTHRSYLVNMRLVREVVPQVGGGVSLVMGDRRRSMVPVARRQATEVRQRLGV